MTHFATSDEEDLSYSLEQLRVFRELVPALRAEFGPGLLLHAANSGAIARMPESWLDMVRPGLVSYGIPPSPDPTPLDLRPCLALRGRVQPRPTPADRAIPGGEPRHKHHRQREDASGEQSEHEQVQAGHANGAAGREWG